MQPCATSTIHRLGSQLGRMSPRLAPPRLASMAAFAAGNLWMAQSAWAHHPTGSAVPSTLWHGLLSGIGHPIIGLDHFAFVVGIGLLAGTTGLGLLMPVVFVVAMAGGLGLNVAGTNLPGAELWVALSVLAIGVAIWARGPGEDRLLECVAFSAAGLFHGYALGEAVIGAESTPLAGYIAGLIATQLAIAAIAWQLAKAGAEGSPRLSPAKVRAAGVAIVAIGAVHLAFIAQV